LNQVRLAQLPQLIDLTQNFWMACFHKSLKFLQLSSKKNKIAKFSF